jgi:GTP-binding protein
MNDDRIKQATFEGSYAALNQFPQDKIPEFAFIGRSNVGKSSLINMMCDRKNLVRISNTPGKTQTINFFLINNSLFRLADLPGYGFAKVSKSKREDWQKLIEDYLRNRPNLACTYLLIDARIQPQNSDLEMANRLGEWFIPFIIVFTKCDGIRAIARSENMKLIFEKLKETWQQLPPHILTSTVTKEGKEALLQNIFSLLNPV